MTKLDPLLVWLLRTENWVKTYKGQRGPNIRNQNVALVFHMGPEIT